MILTVSFFDKSLNVRFPQRRMKPKKPDGV